MGHGMGMEPGGLLNALLLEMNAGSGTFVARMVKCVQVVTLVRVIARHNETSPTCSYVNVSPCWEASIFCI